MTVAAQTWQPNKTDHHRHSVPARSRSRSGRRGWSATSSALPIGQPVVYENRTGASGSIAAEYVARAAPDGTTLMAAATSTHATNVHLIKNLSYDPVKNFTPIVDVGRDHRLHRRQHIRRAGQFGHRAGRLRQGQSR